MDERGESFPLGPDFEGKYKPIFDNYGQRGIPLSEIRKQLLEQDDSIPRQLMRELIRKADSDKDGHLNYNEFIRLMQLRQRHLTRFQRLVRGAVSTVVPRGAVNEYGEDVIDSYIDHYTCKPPPLFMILISVIETIVFIVYAVILHKRGTPVTANTGCPTDSPLIFNPSRRYEAWRFLSYMLMHVGYLHLIFNLIFQLLLGIPLELVHKWWRLLIVYFLGVIAGSLCHTVFDQTTYLAGASGGCYALIGAHFAIVIMNWKEMTHDWMDGVVKFVLSAPVRLAFWTILAGADIGVAVYKRYFLEETTNVGYAAHLGGALAGLLIGIPVMKNIKKLKWEKVVFWVSIVLYLLFVGFAVLWNIFYKGFPKTDWTKCCKENN